MNFHLIKRIAKKISFLFLKSRFPPKYGKVVFGSFMNVEPFSKVFGYDRGGPIDRFYIEGFLYSHKKEIKGKVLEIGDNEYTLRFGDEKLIDSYVLHYKEGNEKANFTGDLSDLGSLPKVKFDCIILTQTLQYIYDYKSAIKNAYSLLENDGTLLITVPGISPIDQGELKNSWLWSFSKNGISETIKEILPNVNTTIEAFGNVHVAICFLYGVGLPEVNSSVLNIRDEAYDVLITIRIKK